mmetsp:Transcript_7359/g.19091  ORF Transcript_7359/g.19091 Transcript_7359/m.19091 type:complete len:513 (-) Transcript_7359:103-1641(-)
MELTSTSNNVLTGLLDGALYEGIGLRKPLETFDKLGEITSRLRLDSNTHDRGHGELHVLHRARIGVLITDGTGLGDELIYTDETNSVTARNGFHGFLSPSHHEDGSLNVLEEEIVLLARGVVRAEDLYLLASLDSTGEHTAEGNEPTLIGGGNHFGYVEHKRTAGVAVADSSSGGIIKRAFVQVLYTVLLGLGGGRKVKYNHFKESFMGRKPLLHDTLHKGLLAKLLILRIQLKLKLLKKGLKLGNLILHSKRNDLSDGLNNELHEGTGNITGVPPGPLLCGRVEPVVAPEALSHFVVINTKLLGVHTGKPLKGESPTVKTSRESDSTLLRSYLYISHEVISVGSDDDIGRLNMAGESLVHILALQLELEESTVELVDSDNGDNSLTKSLTKHGLSLHAHTLDAIDHNKGTVGDTESGSYFRGEINMTGGINQVNKEIVALRALGGLLLHLFLVPTEMERNTSGLDGNAPILLVFAGIHVTGISGVGRGNDTSCRHQRVSESRLSVIDMSND